MSGKYKRASRPKVNANAFMKALRAGQNRCQARNCSPTLGKIGSFPFLDEILERDDWASQRCCPRNCGAIGAVPVRGAGRLACRTLAAAGAPPPRPAARRAARAPCPTTEARTPNAAPISLVTEPASIVKVRRSVCGVSWDCGPVAPFERRNVNRFKDLRLYTSTSPTGPSGPVSWHTQPLLCPATRVDLTVAARLLGAAGLLKVFCWRRPRVRFILKSADRSPLCEAGAHGALQDPLPEV